MVSGSLPAVPRADAAPGQWNGRYNLVLFAGAKYGTSPAATQGEENSNATYTFQTSCQGSQCVATALDGPTPTNPTIPQPTRYTWDGSRWVTGYDWKWECYQGDGVAAVWAPARSWSYYAPQTDGALYGTWTTEIFGGPCAGTVAMSVAAFPV